MLKHGLETKAIKHSTESEVMKHGVEIEANQVWVTIGKGVFWLKLVFRKNLESFCFAVRVDENQEGVPVILRVNQRQNVTLKSEAQCQ